MKIFEVAPAKQPEAKPVYADRNQTNELAKNLQAKMPQYRFEVEKKPISPVIYIRVKGATRAEIAKYFQSVGVQEQPLQPEQSGLSGKYRQNILSYEAGGVLYTIVVASAGEGPQDGQSGGIAVSIKEFTPTSLGLAGKTYDRNSLAEATKKAVIEKTKDRPELQEILLTMVDNALKGSGSLPPELNKKLTGNARGQLGVDFGEILAPIMIATGGQKIDFPAEGNFPLVDVTVNGTNYSVKSLTGSGTSFSSIADLMDGYEKQIKNDKPQQKLYSLFKGFHPAAGGTNEDKILRAAASMKLPEYAAATKILGGQFNDAASLNQLVEKMVKGNSPQDYGNFLKKIYPVMTAGGWAKPAGLPQDGAYYMGASDKKPVEKEAGYPSFRARPVQAASRIITYSLGVGMLNAVTKGTNSKAYSDMMTKIVNQSKVYLGKIDIASDGSLKILTKPFNDLQFKFQYHAPSHKPGNNLPGFMIVY